MYPGGKILNTLPRFKKLDYVLTDAQIWAADKGQCDGEEVIGTKAMLYGSGVKGAYVPSTNFKGVSKNSLELFYSRNTPHSNI